MSDAIPRAVSKEEWDKALSADDAALLAAMRRVPPPSFPGVVSVVPDDLDRFEQLSREALGALVYAAPNQTLRVPRAALVERPVHGWERSIEADPATGDLVFRMRPT